MAEVKRDYSKMMNMFQSTAPETQTTTSGEHIDREKGYVDLSISMLEHFPEHPFELYTGERFEDLKESIKEHGVLTPVLVRKLDNGNYQILSGHNRCECAKAVGFKTVPCVVLSNLTDDDALMIVLDSNTKQRGITEMKISEQAHIYALDVAVNKRQGKRSDLIKSIEKNLEILSNDAVSETLSQFDTKLDTTQEIGDKYGISRATVARLLRIDTLIYELKTRIDDGEIAVNAGVELSYLTQQEQEIIDEVICEFNYKLDINKSKQLRELSKSGKLNKVTAVDVFEGRYKKPKTSSKPSVKAVTLKPKFLSKYYAAAVPQNVIEEEIETSIDVWQKIKDKFNGLSIEEIKEQVETLLEENI